MKVVDTKHLETRPCGWCGWLAMDAWDHEAACPRRSRIAKPVEPPIDAEATGNALQPIREADIGRSEACGTCYGVGYRDGVEAAAKLIGTPRHYKLNDGKSDIHNAAREKAASEIRALVDSVGLSKEPK